MEVTKTDCIENHESGNLFCAIRVTKTFVQNHCFFLDLINQGFVDGVFDGKNWQSIFSLDMALNSRVRLDDSSFLSTIALYLLCTETTIFGYKMKSISELLNNENAIYLGLLISRLQHIMIINMNLVSILVCNKNHYGKYFTDF